MRTDTASLLVAASPEALYGAFADGPTLMKWLPPTGMTGTVHEYDFREGGSYRFELTYRADASGGGAGGGGKSSASSDVTRGRFVALVPGRRVVQSAAFDSDDERFQGEMTITWSFEPAESGTRVTVEATNVPPGIRKEDHDAGLRSSLANLAEHVG